MLENVKMMLVWRVDQWTKTLQVNWKVPGLNTSMCSARLGTQLHYEASGDLQVET